VAATILAHGAPVPYPAKPAARPLGSARKLTSIAAAAAAAPTAAGEPVTLGGDPKASKMAERQAARRSERIAARQAERKLRLRASNFDPSSKAESKAESAAAADAMVAEAASSLAVRATKVQPGPASSNGEATVVVTHPVRHGYAFAAGSDASCVCAAHGYRALSSSSAQALPTVASAEACFLWTCDSLRDTGCKVQDYVATITCSAEPAAASAVASAAAAASSPKENSKTAVRQLSAGATGGIAEPNPLEFLKFGDPSPVPTHLPTHPPTHPPTHVPLSVPTLVPTHIPTVKTTIRMKSICSNADSA